MDKPLLRKVKTTHGSYSPKFGELVELRTKIGEFWLRGKKCKKQYEKDCYHAHIVVAKQDYGKHMIHRGVCNVTDAVR